MIDTKKPCNVTAHRHMRDSQNTCGRILKNWMPVLNRPLWRNNGLWRSTPYTNKCNIIDKLVKVKCHGTNLRNSLSCYNVSRKCCKPFHCSKCHFLILVMTECKNRKNIIGLGKLYWGHCRINMQIKVRILFLYRHLEWVEKELTVHSDLPTDPFEGVWHSHKQNVVDPKHQHQHQSRLG